MPGPTTEVLNDDIKILRDDIRGIRDDVHRLDLDVHLQGGQVGGMITGIKILSVLTLTSIGGSIWWGATLTADVKNLGIRMDDKFAAVEKRLDAIDKRFEAVDKRFDGLEASIAKILEQTKAK